MTAIVAMLIDAYRQLNAKRLFWITLILSGGVVLSYASIGFNETGMSYLFGLFSTENELLAEGSPIARMLYRSIFSSFIVSLWLAWVATILALVSTTTIFPDFLAGGAVDIVLSKPIGRVRLFFIKYFTSLLFVVLQVGLFCVGVFFCMGWRIGDWNWLIFAAIPLVTVFYSYLYSVNVLVGVVTRSSLTALLITLLFWSTIFSLNLAEGIVNQFHTQYALQSEKSETAIASMRERVDGLEDDPQNAALRTRLESGIEDEQVTLDENAEVVGKLAPWRNGLRGAQLVLPKTGETIALLDRWLKEDTDVDIMDLLSGNVSVDTGGEVSQTRVTQDREVAQRIVDEMESRSLWYVIGTSVVFEMIVLGLACVVFVRRDY
jgi:ABC-type transport system involved in multi-copper enzyme maturation permease subunit